MSKKKQYLTSHARFENKKTTIDRIADFLTSYFGTVGFLVLNVFVFFLWLAINSGLVPNVPIFDPYPHGFLTTAVSLEAIFLSIIVLMSQNRASKISELREDLDLEVNIEAENEITRLLNMVDEIHNHLGLKPERDAELRRMKKKMDLGKIQKELARQFMD